MLKFTVTPLSPFELRHCPLLQENKPKECEQFLFQLIPSLWTFCQYALFFMKGIHYLFDKKTERKIPPKSEN